MVMHRSLSAAALVASLLIGLHPPRAVAAPPETLSRARALLGRGEARPAVPLLEGALPTVSPDDRPALLRRAYDLAARQAEDAGQSDEAGAYRDNLEILNRRPRTEPASAPAPGPVAESCPEAPAPTDPAVARAPAVAQTSSPPAPAPS